MDAVCNSGEQAVWLMCSFDVKPNLSEVLHWLTRQATALWVIYETLLVVLRTHNHVAADIWCHIGDAFLFCFVFYTSKVKLQACRLQ